MYYLLRRILFIFDPEKIHHIVTQSLLFFYKIPIFRSLLTTCFRVTDKKLERTLWGITFPNPVGLAGGFDKNAEFTDPLACLGFGFVEIGTLTPRPQLGNPKPRLFRLPADKALINRMGFNNNGVQNAIENLKKRQEKIIIVGNIGKNKDTKNEDASADYEICFNALYDHVDLFVVNVSSPNTPGLRALQEKEPLTKLLNRLMDLNKEHKTAKPILLKIAPDLTNEQLDDIIEIIQQTQLSGIVATNTTISRYGLVTPGDKVKKCGDGGLSGLPLKQRSTEVISYINNKTKGGIPIIATGGIFTAQDALEKLNAGASLVQLYTGFVYEGPAIAKNICTGLLKSK